MTISERFEAGYDNRIKFIDNPNKRATRRDLHGMMLLDSLFPTDNTRDLISASEHDQLWFSISEEQIETLTDDQIRELCGAGICYDESVNSLTMFT